MTHYKINFDLAGLDLIIDKSGDVWFIEANSFPGFFKEQIKSKEKKLKNALGKKLTAFVPENRKLSDTYTSLLRSLTDFHVIYVKENNLIKTKFDKNTKILAWKSAWKEALSKNNYVINSKEISKLTSDKYETYKLIEDAGIRTPKTLLINSINDIEEVFKKWKYKKLILKPRFGCRGENIEILDQNSYKEKNLKLQDKEYILQEFIEVENKNNLFADYRVLVAGGKYIGAIMRESTNPVVNLCLGGKIRNVNKETNQKLAPIAEKIVKIFVESF